MERLKRVHHISSRKMPKDLDALLDLCLWIGFLHKWGWKPHKNPSSFQKGQKGAFLKYKLSNTYAQILFFPIYIKLAILFFPIQQITQKQKSAVQANWDEIHKQNSRTSKNKSMFKTPDASRSSAHLPHTYTSLLVTTFPFSKRLIPTTLCESQRFS